MKNFLFLLFAIVIVINSLEMWPFYLFLFYDQYENQLINNFNVENAILDVNIITYVYWKLLILPYREKWLFLYR